MPDMKEVFEMVTQKSGPDRGALQRQHDRQDHRHRRQRIGAILVAAAVIAGLAVFFLTNPFGDSNGRPADQGSTPAPNVAPVSSGATMSPAFVGLDGSVVSAVNLAPDAWEPNLSSDGEWIVYVTRSIDVGNCGACIDAPRLAVVRSDGTQSHFLTYAGTDISQPIWSPDGTKVAFVKGNGSVGSGNIAVIDADGSHAITLTSGPTQKSWPSWSLDGTSIVYDDAGSTPLDDSGFSNTQELYLVPADGSGSPERITHNSVPDSAAVYSPDGTRIALFHGGTFAIMNADGSHIRSIADGFSPRWSPDGSKIVFFTYNSAERFDLPDPRTGSGGDWPRLDLKLLTVASGEIADLGLSVASDVNVVSWASDGRSLFVNRASNPTG